MSLVNLSHVCSHLQNASLARLGLTSIPYTRLHLSLSLLLQKQGFLSQVKLAGPSPPASCFPPGEDNLHVTGHPRSDRGQRTPEAALQQLVKIGPKGEAGTLKRMGFDNEAIEFALSRREKTKAQLDAEGWADVAARFFIRHDGQSLEELQAQGVDPEAIAIIEKYKPVLEACRGEVFKWHGDREAFEQSEKEAEKLELRQRKSFEFHLRERLGEQMLREGFEVDILRYFAGENRYVTFRELQRDGIDLDVMGLTVSNQPFHGSVPEQYADPWQLEEEGVVTQANRASRRLWLGLKYWDGLPVLTKARMLSKPTKRINLDTNDLGKLVRGRQAGEVKPLTQVGEIMAVSTKLGVMEIRECVERKLGGMVLCRIW